MYCCMIALVTFCGRYRGWGAIEIRGLHAALQFRMLHGGTLDCGKCSAICSLHSWGCKWVAVRLQLLYACNIPLYGD
jgi:hypothetical protein